jgi:undecaprenyl-diphosphatase
LLGNLQVASVSLLIGGIIIILFENYYYKYKKVSEEISNPNQNVEDLSIRQLLILGAVQSLAVIPGVSRSGAVIICGRMLGLGNVLITEFSFLLAVPTMLFATIYDIYKSGFSLSRSEWGSIGLGFIVSFIVAFIVIRWLLDYIRTHSFKIFGWYRIFIGIILILGIYLGFI